MWQQINLFWRYFITGFAAILLSAVAAVVLVDYLESRDNRTSFLQDTQYVMQAIETNGLSHVLDSADGDFPFTIQTTQNFLGKTGRVTALNKNQFSITYKSVAHGFITLTDKPIYNHHVKQDGAHNTEQEEKAEQEEKDEWFANIELVTWLTTIVMLLGLGFYWINHQTQRHIQHLVKASKAISLGNFDTTVPTESPEPIKQLAQQLDTTRLNIKHLVEKERTLAFAIPHELRTPLSKIRLALELSREHHTVQEYEQLVEDLDAYTDELEQLISDLLSLARTEEAIHTSAFSLADMLQDLADEYRLLYPNKQLIIDNQVQRIHSGEVQIRLILNNLLQNACKYAAQNIEIATYTTNDTLTITIANDGQPIPQDMQQRIFHPFTRVDSSRNRKTGGAGLGLALVSQSAKQLGGSIELITDRRHEKPNTTLSTYFSLKIPLPFNL